MRRLHVPRYVGGKSTTSFEFTAGTMPSGATLTRASTGWHFSSGLNLTAAAIDVARFDYRPTTGTLRGLLVEPAATNSVRNASATGTVAGSPGTPPTFWALQGSPVSALVRTLGTPNFEDGIPFVDIQWAGTTSSGPGGLAHRPETVGIVAASVGQTWWLSAYIKLIAGTVAGTTFPWTLSERDAGTVQVGFQQVFPVPTSAPLRQQRYEIVRTLTAPTVASLIWDLSPSIFGVGTVIDFTMRIGLPQMQLIDGSASPIVTTAGTVTRAADVLTLTPLPGTYNVSIVRESGTTTVNGVVVTGAGYVVPTNFSPLRQVMFTSA